MSNKITGMMKVFYNNFLNDYTNTLAVLSGTGASELYDNDRSTKWQSSGSSDLITETILIDFTDAQTIDYLMLVDMNFKSFTAKYWNGSSYVYFSNVSTYYTAPVANSFYGVGVYGAAKFSETSSADSDNSLNTRYFEFDAVSVSKVLIEITKTIVANDEKYLHQLYIGQTIGTFINDLACKPNSYKAVASDKNKKLLKLSNGGSINYERSDKYNAKVKIKNMWESLDQSIIETLFDIGEFIIWPCGGYGEYTNRGWRLQDVYSVVIDSDLESEFTVGRVKEVGTNYKFKLLEQ